MNRLVVLFMSLWHLSCGGSPAAEVVYRFHKDVERKGAAGEEILSVRLDADVYAVTRPDYPDIRIRDAAGAEVPYMLEQSVRPRSQLVQEPCPSEVVSLRFRGDEVLEIVLRLDAKAPDATGLTVISPLADFEHRVRVLPSVEMPCRID